MYEVYEGKRTTDKMKKINYRRKRIQINEISDERTFNYGVLTGNKHSFPFQINKGTTLHWYFSNYLGNFRYPGNVSNY